MAFVLHPSIKWAQRKDKVLLTIELEDCQEPVISLEGSKLSFSSKGGHEQKFYELDLAFYDEVVPEQSKQNVTSREICFNIKKKNEGPYWPRLLKDKSKPHYLHTDFNKWRDEDDSDEEDPHDNEDNFEDMINKMGGAGLGQEKFDPGEVDSDDSDDEALPDLEG